MAITALDIKHCLHEVYIESSDKDKAMLRDVCRPIFEVDIALLKQTAEFELKRAERYREGTVGMTLILGGLFVTSTLLAVKYLFA